MIFKFATRLLLGFILVAAALFIALTPAVSGFKTPDITCFKSKNVAGVPLPHVENPCGNINPNTADFETLQQLNGIGPVLAQAIINERNLNGPYYFPEDLISAKGIGEKRLAAIWQQLNFTTLPPIMDIEKE